MKVELHATRSRTPEICATVAGYRRASPTPKEYPTIHRQNLAEVDNQPYLEAIMLGGANPGKGTILVDSGACFTMVTELFAEKHGYPM